MQSNIFTYCGNGKSHKNISATRELELVTAAKAGNKQAAQELIEHHVALIKMIIKKSSAALYVNIDDLFQEACIGMLKAMKKFDPKYDVRFSSYAYKWIKAAIDEYRVKNSGIIKMYTTKAQKKAFFNISKYKKDIECHDFMTDCEVAVFADLLQISEEDVRSVETRMMGSNASFTEYISDPSGKVSGHGQYTPNYAIDYESDFTSDVELIEESKMLNHAINTLDKRKQDIIRSRWLSDDVTTFQQLAKKYNVSLQRIQQLESIALKEMHQIIST